MIFFHKDTKAGPLCQVINITPRRKISCVFLLHFPDCGAYDPAVSLPPPEGTAAAVFGVIAMLLAVSGPVGLLNPLSALSLAMPGAAGVFLT